MKKPLYLTLITFVTLGLLTSFATSDPKPESKKPLNIILLIGDGMGLAQIYSAYTANFANLNILKFPVTGISRTSSANRYITDSAAGATAISTGQKTNNGMIATDTAGKPLPTILEIVKKEGLSAGLVVTCTITHATPAAFVSHCADREYYDDIALDFLKSDVDVFIGGGLKYFNHRADGKDLTVDLKKKGYTLITDTQSIKNCTKSPLAALINIDALPTMANGRGAYLPNSTNKAIELLNTNKKGFFLMVEGSQIDWGGHGNDIQYVLNETLDFDKAVGNALEFAKKDGNTLVIVTADHETGGLVLMNGDYKNGKVETKFSTNYHTATPVMVFAFGPGSENFTGCYENTELFYKMLQAYGFENSK